MKYIPILLLLLISAFPVHAQQPDLSIEPRFLFPIDLLCGPASESLQEGVVRGSYQTVIHVRNPSSDTEVRIAKTITRSLPYQSGLPHAEVIESSIGPNDAIVIDCDEMRQMQASSMTMSFRLGYLILWSDGTVDVAAGWSGGPRGNEIETFVQAKIDGTELCPFSIDDPGTRAHANRICLGFSWTCENPASLSVAIDGNERGMLSLARTEDFLLGDGSSTFCASTTDFANGMHTLSATLACEVARCTLERVFEVENTPFRLISVEPDRKRYRGSDTVRIRVEFSESVDELEADFTLLDSGFEDDRLTIDETDTLGTYLIEYAIDGIDNTNPAGIYPVPLTVTDQGITRRFNGLRIAYVGGTRNLLAPVDFVPATTIVGGFPSSGTSEVAAITDIDVSNHVILPLTSVTVTGTVGGAFIEDQPRDEVEAAARNYALIWRERDQNAAGAYRIRPAMLELNCTDDGEQICESASFSVTLSFPTRTNEIAEQGPHDRQVDFAIVDSDGEVSEIASVDLSVVVLSEEMYSGTPQSNSGTSASGTVGAGIEFRLGEGIPEGAEGNPLTLVLTWGGETGPGAEVIPGEDENPQTLTALDLNIGIHRAQANGHGGWFGNLGNAELVRKSNTCFSGLGLGQFSDDRWNCVCSDASSLNMEVITYPPGTELDEGGDGDGTFGAEYYIYDSCGSQQNTVATLTAYYCGSVEQHSFEIEAALSEEDEDLEQNWNHGCLFGSPCHDPKTVPTGFNETGGFYQGFDFNPTDCSNLPVVSGHVGYRAPVNFALNDPSAAPEKFDPDPALDKSWSAFDENLSETGWSAFDVPFAKIEVSLVDGSEAIVGETFTDEDGNFSLILPADYADEGDSGLVRVEIITLSEDPYAYRVIQSLDDLDDSGTEDLYRAVLADNFDPVANGGNILDVSLNSGPNDEANKEIAAAFHIYRNSILGALHVLTLGRFVVPYTALYDRDLPLLNNTCSSQGSFYSGEYTHIQSIGPSVTQFVCPDGQTAMDGTCNAACVLDPNETTYGEARADFNYDTHLHEYAHHVFTQLTSIDPERFEERGNASHFGNSSEKTSLTEGIAEAFGQTLVSKLIYDMYGPGQLMNTTQVSCSRDDNIDCNLGSLESVDWLTITDKGNIVRPGPDWQPQKDCPPGAPGCGCFLGSCSVAGTSCQAGYCINDSGACNPGSLSCSVGSGCADDDAAEVGGFCVLPVTYSDGWTWRVLWDLIDEGEDVQPEVSHWRTSQMSNAESAVPNPYDMFGDVDGFWRSVMSVVEDTAIDPVAMSNTQPNLADLITRYRCRLEGEEREALDVYLEEVVEFPYHNPTACP